MDENQEEIQNAYVDGFMDGIAGYLTFCSNFEDCEGCPIASKLGDNEDCDDYIVNHLAEASELIYNATNED